MPAKILRLQRWRAAVDDQGLRLQNPEGHRETLPEMADTTYRHAVEELQYSPRYYRGFSTYDLAQNDNRNLLGPISRSIFNFDSDQPRPGPRSLRIAQ